MEAEQQAAEQNAAAAAASSALGVAAATVKKPVRSAAPAPRTPPVDNQQVTQSNQPDTTTVIVTEVNQGGSLPTTSRQAQMPTGLPQFSGASIGNVRGFSSDGGSTETAADEVLAISLFTRTNYVPPVYPRSAQRRNLSGAVELEFTVNANGTVTNIEVLSSKPGDTFNQAAMDAVKKWRFEPVIENGRPVEKRTAVRLSFDLE
jgi:protein TonB